MSGAWIDHRPVRCKCGHEWAAEMLQNVAATVWIAHVKSWRCPQCGRGWRSISLVLAKEAAP